MPIDLSEPPTPEQAQLASVQRGPAVLNLDIGEARLHLYGPPPPEAQLRQLVAAAQTLSDVVYAIRAAYYAEGFPALRTGYALIDNDLYVVVIPLEVTALDVPDRYRQYFDHLPRGRPLDDDELERARTLASAHADRAGEQLQLKFVPEDGGAVLKLEESAGDLRQGSVEMGFGNPGNRFLGRYFADLTARRSFASGDELSGVVNQGFPRLDDDSHDAKYTDVALAWSHVSEFGIFAFAGSYADYEQRPEIEGFGRPYTLEGDLRQFQAGWQNLLGASFRYRWTVSAQIDYTRKHVDVAPLDQVLQHQGYTSVELATGYRTSFAGFDRIWTLDMSLAVRQGLGDDDTGEAEVLADLGYWLLRPEFALQLALSERQTVQLQVTSQWTDDTLPEQQQWLLGGSKQIEAYLPGVAVGDSGALARLQWQWSGPDWNGFTLTPGLFAEYGITEYSRTLPGMVNQGAQSLADVGVSLGLRWRRYFKIDVSAATPLSHSGLDRDTRDDARADVLFRLSAGF